MGLTNFASKEAGTVKERSPGILNTSDIYFYTRSVQAKRMYFYLLCTGHYYCDHNYSVDRQNYDSFLIIYVQSGSGQVEQSGVTAEVKSGSLIFLDCYRPHRYHTNTAWEIYWVHFDGVLARAYYEQITKNGFVLTPQNPYNAEHSLHKIFKFFHEKNKANEAVISKRLTDLLTELILASSAGTIQSGQADALEDTLAYISENAANPITVDQLAARANLSPFYFTRIFKKETGFTPHEYVIRVRVNMAKFYLKTSALPLKEIAFRSGFNSECSFCTSFKKVAGLTPGAYRRDIGVV